MVDLGGGGGEETVPNTKVWAYMVAWECLSRVRGGALEEMADKAQQRKARRKRHEEGGVAPPKKWQTVKPQRVQYFWHVL